MNENPIHNKPTHPNSLLPEGQRGVRELVVVLTIFELVIGNFKMANVLTIA